MLSGKNDLEQHYKERKRCDVAVRRWEVVPDISDSLDKDLEEGKGEPIPRDHKTASLTG